MSPSEFAHDLSELHVINQYNAAHSPPALDVFPEHRFAQRSNSSIPVATKPPPRAAVQVDIDAATTTPASSLLAHETQHSPMKPFTRQFPLELTAEIVSQMERKELLAFSLVNKLYNDEANRVLWRTAHIAFDADTRTLVPAAKAIRRDASRARHIRTLVIAPKRVFDSKRRRRPSYSASSTTRAISPSGQLSTTISDHRHPDLDADTAWRKSQVQNMYVPEEVPLWTWKLVMAVIRDLPLLEHLEVRDEPYSWMGQVAWHVPLVERLLELSVTSPKALTGLKEFTTSIPLQNRISLFLSRCPQLERIVLHRFYPGNDDLNDNLPSNTNAVVVPHSPPQNSSLLPSSQVSIPSSSTSTIPFQHLKHITGPIDFVSLTIPGHPLTHIHTNLGGALAAESLSLALVKSTADCLESLTISSIFSSGGHPIVPALERLARVPVRKLRVKYLISSTSLMRSLGGGETGASRSSELWSTQMARALSTFPALETFQCDFTVSAPRPLAGVISQEEQDELDENLGTTVMRREHVEPARVRERIIAWGRMGFASPQVPMGSPAASTAATDADGSLRRVELNFKLPLAPQSSSRSGAALRTIMTSAGASVVRMSFVREAGGDWQIEVPAAASS
ncbi:hypothetical protein DL93DRAFT_2162200 [Clavulina sp. PMI_390]|nr:hypothetical protein DL93DRAFT_2162200 [Clavulina sp. PMI_390]